MLYVCKLIKIRKIVRYLEERHYEEDVIEN